MTMTVNNRGSGRKRTNRRNFLKTTTLRSAAGGLSLLLSGCGWSQKEDLEIPRRILGKTKESVTMIGLGGWNMGRIAEESEALNLIAAALDRGINFFDTAWDYQDGESERRLGRGLGMRRQDVFLMTKILARDEQGARQQLEESLKRLGTDYLDLLQFHSIREVGDVERIFGPGGAMEAARRAQDNGQVRYLGITGHFDPRAHERALDHHQELDTIQFPVNCVDPASSLSFVRRVLPRAHSHNLGILAMKTLAMGRFLEHQVASVQEALSFVWSQPVSVLISGFDSVSHLEENVRLALQFQPMDSGVQRELMERVAIHAGPQVEYYKREVESSA